MFEYPLEKLKQNRVIINVCGMSDNESILHFGKSTPNKAINGIWRQPLNLEQKYPIYASEDRSRWLLLKNDQLASLVKAGYAKVTEKSENPVDRD